jgi:two-component system sensor histidine kinase KdpD
MLLEAHRLMADGIDVAAGIVETHGRSETESLLGGLRIIPPVRISYKGIDISELDLDRVLDERPSVVLVDELAHTNAPGSRNAKRYQDVEEILSAGIHVITTLNVQHLESLYEMVESATGVKVKERLPDRVVAEADQVVNVDLTAEDLRRRLKEGKIYGQERISTALDNFFRFENLEQLREISLREMASHIDSKRRNPLDGQIPSNPDQVMVCLSSRGPNSEAHLRYASRLAGRLNRNWYAVYVQTESERPAVIDSETQRILADTLSLAQQLGATVFTYRGDDIVKTILQFAREYRVGHIVIGTSGRKQNLWQRIRGESGIIERLISESRGITVVVLDTRQLSEKNGKVHGNGTEHSQHDNDIKSLVSVISAERTVIWNSALDKEKAVRDLVSVCCLGNPSLSYEDTLKALMHRELQGSTFFGEDVAIPHARIEEISSPVVAIGLSRYGIFEPETGHSTRIMIMLVSPMANHNIHVTILGKISRICRDAQLIKRLLKADNNQNVIDILNESGL